MEKCRDYHLESASKIFGVPLDKVTPEQRKMAKSYNFARMYTKDMGPRSWGKPYEPEATNGNS